MNNELRRQQHVRYPFERFASVTSYTGFDFLTNDPSWITLQTQTGNSIYGDSGPP
jgi:hypothetical protein